MNREESVIVMMTYIKDRSPLPPGEGGRRPGEGSEPISSDHPHPRSPYTCYRHCDHDSHTDFFQVIHTFLKTAMTLGKSRIKLSITCRAFSLKSAKFPSASALSRLTMSVTPRSISRGIRFRFATQAIAPDSQSTTRGRYRFSSS